MKPSKGNVYPVEYAVLSGNIDFLKFFSKHYKLSEIFIDQVPGICRYCEVRNPKPEIIRFMLENGSSPDSHYELDGHIISALIICMVKDNYECFKVFIDFKANIFLGNQYSPLNLAIKYVNEVKDYRYYNLIKLLNLF